MVTNLQIQTLLRLRGKTGVSLVDYILADRSDGNGPYISFWNEASLGPMPTQEELDSITQAQMNATNEQLTTNSYTTTSRKKDILATIALIVRAKNPTAWNSMTLAEKKAAVLAEADVWVTIRSFI